MRVLGFFVAVALLSYTGGAVVGWGLSDEEIKKAMCSYYSEWEFCKGYKTEPIKDLALSGLSKKVHELERQLRELSVKLLAQRGEEFCVKATRLNIRLYPLNGKVIGQYEKGERVRVIDRIGGWARTKEGWVSERYLERCKEEG